MAFPFLAAAAALTVVGAGAQFVATQSQVKAQKKEARIQRAISQIEANRRARRAVAERRIQQAELLAQANASNQGVNSAVSGAVGSLSTQTAANIGAANTRLAAETFQNNVLLRGARRASLFGTIASGAGALSSVAGTAAQLRPTRQAASSTT